ncbi:GNAT family N-acetyltransferase [Pseudomonas sp. BLCC-B112]|nr:GNAT family N-acetyltransferase [Pseudomonas sp. BLCC-B112]MDC7818507.1 GNAT family N-acetyltransferase [Pseudomonas sp. BLCC-B112]
MLFVAPLWRRRGVGKRLVNAALEQARAERHST